MNSRMLRSILVFLIFSYTGISILFSQCHTYYNYNDPQAVVLLDEALQEISALGYDPISKELYTVQDEAGWYYVLDKTDGKIIRKSKFWQNGDYEGLEYYEGQLFIVKSSGTLFRVSNLGAPEQKTIKHKNYLNKNDDIEGMCYDAKANRLLISCKGFSYGHENARHTRKFFHVDPISLVLDSTALFTISRQDYVDFLSKSTRKEHEKILKKLEEDKTKFKFFPSAIAIHPDSRNIYVLSSKGKTLNVLNPGGQLIAIYKLKKSIYTQPEGMIFDEDSTLYISNEGKDAQASLIRLEARSQ